MLIVRSQDEAEEGDDGIDQDSLSSETLRSLHEKMDADKDGKVSMAEIIDFSHMMRRTVAKKDIHGAIDEMDAEKDGMLSHPELMKDLEQWGDEGEEDKALAAKRKELETAKFKAADQDG